MKRCNDLPAGLFVETACQAVVAGVVGLLGLAISGTPVMAAEAAKPGISQEKRDVVVLSALLDPALSDREQAQLTTIQKSFADAQAVGNWDPSLGHPLAYLPAGTVLLQALRRNLSIQIGKLDAEMAKQAIEEANAVFAPVFYVDLGQSGSMVYERQNSGPVYLQKFWVTPTNGQPYLDVQSPGAYQTNRLGFLKTDPNPNVVNQTYDLSKQQRPGWLMTETGSLTIQQQLPWGSSLTLTNGTSYKESYYDPNHEKSWDAPWAVSVSASLNSPLPYSKNYGPYSKLNTDLEQKKIGDKQVNWQLKAVINDTLQSADLAYWDLVSALENLLAAIENRRYLGERAAHADRLLAAGRVTQYGRDQMAMGLASAKVQEASARQSLVAASTALAMLIEEGRKPMSDALLLPVAYQERLAEETKSVDGKGAIATALAQRPELQVRDLDVQSSLLARHFQENQTRPDLTFSGSGSMSQSNAQYGYKSYTDAVSNVLSPDSRAFNGSVTYVYPWQNRAAKATLAMEDHAVEGAQLSKQAAEQAVSKEVNDALVSLASGRARLSSARNNEKLAALALEKARDRWEIRGDLSEMELLNQSTILLNARLARIAAMIDHQKAKSRLAAAQGILAGGLAGQTAVNPFDRQRVALLEAGGATPNFTNRH